GMHTGGGALAMTMGDDWGSDQSDQAGNDDHGKADHDNGRPHGGMHTGGGALALTTAVTTGDDGGSASGVDRGDSWKGDHDKSREDVRPHGGMHTGGGGMAVTNGGLAAGSMLLLGGMGAGAFVLRRRRSSVSGLSAA
ncbi:hypothetical protein AB0436_10600, partial [Streptomyces sp. NPDC051322]|uniref:hypothetical protein n=1 Tax=Streptomyces sp. NPDC051322 TaxID=3154645 RepID=UPI00345069BA